MEKKNIYVEKLMVSILDMSKSKIWEEAKQEWEYQGSEIIHGSQCLCGKDIVEVCYIRNKITGNETEIGNKCVNHFLAEVDQIGLEKNNKVFKTLKSIKKNPGYSAPMEVALIGYQKSDMDVFQLITYYDIIKRKKLTPVEKEFKIKMNRKIENGFTSRKQN